MPTGQSMVELPHARIAGGPSTLVILEGLTLENKAPTGRALRLLRWVHKRYTGDYTVYQVARRPGSPAGHTTRDMADDYASWIGARFDGPVDVIGFSTGGEVAQYLAADHGELVRRLVLSDTGCRLGRTPRRCCERPATRPPKAGRPRPRPTSPTTSTSDASAKAW
jgi:pimeloyl-ACP methyl ester carboxylesterase